jgi:hypothetical protein
MGKLARANISDKLIGMGDSHLDNFTFFCAATCRIPGATAYGLTNPLSDTKARNAFTKFINVFANHIPLLCIGEVDCNSLPWRSNEHPSPEVFIMYSVDHLFQFLDEFNRKFILPSVTLPPVESYQELSIRTHVSAGKAKRTELVKLYNTYLKEGCSRLGHHYLDITTPTMNVDGLIDPSFIVSPFDVHLKPHTLYDIVRNNLNSIEVI